MLDAAIRSQLPSGFVLDVHLQASPGITMVFGESGSGKTTLLRCLAGLRTPDAGRITVGTRVWFDAESRVNRPVQTRGLGYVFQDLALFPHMTVEQNLRYGLPRLSSSERATRTQTIAESFRIAHLLRRKPRDISGGERQRAALARSLVTDPALLLLDEPLSALDHVTQSRIIEDLRAWNAARGIPILYVTHSHREVFALGAHLVVLEKGRIVAQGRPGDVLHAPDRESVAQLAGFENFLDARVRRRLPALGTMQCRLSGGDVELEVPVSNVVEGGDVRIAVRAGDILLATEEPRGLSARNVLPGSIRSVQREGVTVIAIVDAGVPFEVHLTPAALTSLQLAEEQRVWLVIKTHSCRIVS
jgi:molybdate transport system ATP-binding protein